MKTLTATLATLAVTCIYLSPTAAAEQSTRRAADSDICQSTCLRGNTQSYGWATASNAAPCWKREPQGYFSCFDYLNGKCQWPDMTDCRANKQPDTTKPPVQTTAPPISTTTTPPTPPSKPQICQSKCLRGGFAAGGWAYAPNAPPCWKQQGEDFACFEYVNGKCEWSDLTDCKNTPAPSTTSVVVTSAPTPTSSVTPAPTTPSVTTTPATDICVSKCLRGGFAAGGWAYAPRAPPCWMPDGDHYSCFEYVNGKCEWSGLTDCGKRQGRPGLRG